MKNNNAEEKIKIIQRQEEEESTKKLADELNLPYLNLDTTPIDPGAVGLFPLENLMKAKILIFQKFGKNLKIALLSPENKETIKFLEKLEKEGYKISRFIVSETSLNNAWKKIPKIALKRKKITKEIEITSQRIKELQKEIKHLKDIQVKLSKSSDLSTTEVLEIIIAGALKIEASDIHFEAEEENLRLRYRIDGILQDVADLPYKLYNPILSRIKILSELKINIHNVPQDGRFSIVIENQEIEIRTSIMPGAYGENIVLRILNPKTISLELEDLGLEQHALEIIKKEIKKPHGMIINTGPTGSGKTTTLYAFIKKINKPEIKIITLENPIEYHLEGIEQTQINPEKGYTFANGLRAVLRQDPDVILLGEIRDNETAETAIHAALTGHLVFTTLHTNNAAGAIPRLIDMGINPKLIPSAVNLVIAQRLVRRVCKYCAEKYKPEAKTLNLLKKELQTIPQKIKKEYPALDKNLIILKPGKGCEKCNFSGYKGRIAVMELFVLDETLEEIIFSSPSISKIQEVVTKKGMITMKQDGLLKVLKKITTLEEVERVLGE